MLGPLVTTNEQEDVGSYIITRKNNVSKRSMVANELLLLVLAVTHSYTILRMLPAEVLQTIRHVVFPGDSTLVAALFNAELRITNTLVWNGVFQIKGVCRGIVCLCPNAVVFLNCIECRFNVADLNYKV